MGTHQPVCVVMNTINEYKARGITQVHYVSRKIKELHKIVFFIILVHLVSVCISGGNLLILRRIQQNT